MRSVEIPDDLAKLVQTNSDQELSAFVVKAVQEKLAREKVQVMPTLGEMLDKGYKLPVADGTPRADGLPWSEVESACDAA